MLFARPLNSLAERERFDVSASGVPPLAPTTPPGALSEPPPPPPFTLSVFLSLPACLPFVLSGSLSLYTSSISLSLFCLPTCFSLSPSLYLSVCLSVLSVCLPVRMTACLSLSARLPICLPLSPSVRLRGTRRRCPR